MKRFCTTQVREDMSQVLDAARQQPVIIRYHRRDTAVIMSLAEYRRLQALETPAAKEEAEIV